jgi:hypothetical protein
MTDDRRAADPPTSAAIDLMTTSEISSRRPSSRLRTWFAYFFFFAIAWGVAAYVFIEDSIVGAVFSSILFGGGMATFHTWRRQRVSSGGGRRDD